MIRAVSFFLLLLLSIAANSNERVAVVGKWYDDLGSPKFLDSTLTIEEENGRYFFNRRNGDGSGGRFKLEKAGNAYTKVGDKFGAKYLVMPEGLELHDRAGYIRTAKPKQ
jgi:hypothetical protein